jgi:sodium/bile acid cotransporter 7
VAKLKYGDFRIVQALNSFLVFLVSGLTLQSSELISVLRRPFSAVYGVVTILLLTPLLALLTTKLPLKPEEFSTGLSIFCIVPTTLSVGVALTQAAKGNQALALLLTVGTNILGIVTVPHLLKFLLGGQTGLASLDPQDLTFKLTLTALVPTIVGHLAARSSNTVREFVKRNRVPLSLFSTLNLIAMVWQSLSGARDLLIRQSLPNIVSVIISGIAVHLLYLVLNYIAVKALGLPIREAVTVLIMAR